MPLPAIILAAGGSRRLGQPKQLVSIAGEALLARAIRIVRESGAEPLIVVLGAHCDFIASSVDLSDVQSVTNPNWGQGIATSIHAGIQALLDGDRGAEAVLLLVCDQPKLTAQHLRALIAAHQREGQAKGQATIVASEYAGIAGIPAIFPANQFANLLKLRGDSGARYLLRQPDCPIITLPFEGGEVDIDTPEDLAGNI
jgi:CTP:molybdopterin cytidylyltransferase MocA